MAINPSFDAARSGETGLTVMSEAESTYFPKFLMQSPDGRILLCNASEAQALQDDAEWSYVGGDEPIGEIDDD